MSALARLKSKPVILAEPVIGCVVCGGERWIGVAKGFDYEYETCGNEWSYHACDSCGHVQIKSVPESAAISTIYPSHYYSYRINDVVHPVALWAKGLLDRLKFKSITAHLKAPPQSYLDVGCGDGRYLQQMISKGVSRNKAFGVELDPKAVEYATSKGLSVTQCRIEDAGHLPNDGLDLITMFHVIEHVARPDQVVAKLQSLLVSGGMLAIETPNIDSLDARLARKGYWGGYHIPRHWHVFTPESMTLLLEKAGYKVVAIRYQTGHAFWLWTLHHWLKYGKNMHRLAEICHPLRNVPLLALVTAFDIVRAKLGARTSAMLVLAVKI